MGRNYEITEVRGYSGHYVRQKNGNVHYRGNLDGDQNGRAPEIYLDSDNEHHIHSVRAKGQRKLYTIGDKTPNGIINGILLIEGEIWFNHGHNGKLNLSLKELSSDTKTNKLLLLC